MCTSNGIARIYFSPFIGIQLGIQNIYVKGGSLDSFLGMPDYGSSTQYNFASIYSIGFYISHKFSIEFAYNALHRYSTEIDIKTIVGNATGVVSRKLSGYDFLAYGYWPIKRCYFYIGVGTSLINAQYFPVSVHFDSMIFPYDLGGTYHRNFIRPKAALGFGYRVSNNVLLSLAYARIFHVGKTLQQDIILYLPAIDFVGIGITVVFL